MKKRLMILGAGIYQVPLILTARRMGIETVVVSVDGNYPGFALADIALKLDTTDRERILQAAAELSIDGILTTGTDVAVRSIGYVCERLGLPGIHFMPAHLCTDKAAMKQAFAAGGVPTAPFRIVRSLAEAREAAEQISYPVMMKACDVSGSRGITRVDEPSHMEEAFHESVKASQTKHYIVEKFIPGQEIGVDAFVQGGEVKLCLPHRKFVYTAGRSCIPGGHAFPLTLDHGPLQKGETTAQLEQRIREVVEKIVKATGMDECAVNCDMILCPDGGISVLEAGARCGATCIPELIEVYTGINCYEQMILGAMGRPTDYQVRRQLPCMAKLLVSRTGGRIQRIDEERIRTLEEETGAVIHLDYQEGDRIRPLRNGTDRFGHVIWAVEEESRLDELMEQVYSCIVLEKG